MFFFCVLNNGIVGMEKNVNQKHFLGLGKLKSVYFSATNTFITLNFDVFNEQKFFVFFFLFKYLLLLSTEQLIHIDFFRWSSVFQK